MIFSNFDNTKNDYLKMLFNVINGPYFLSGIKMFLNQEGFGDDNVYCLFPDERETDDEPFEGVKVVALVYDDEVIISYKLFLETLIEACYVFIKNNKDKSEEVLEFIEKARNKINILDI